MADAWSFDLGMSASGVRGFGPVTRDGAQKPYLPRSACFTNALGSTFRALMEEVVVGSRDRHRSALLPTRSHPFRRGTLLANRIDRAAQVLDFEVRVDLGGELGIAVSQEPLRLD